MKKSKLLVTSAALALALGGFAPVALAQEEEEPKTVEVGTQTDPETADASTDTSDLPAETPVVGDGTIVLTAADADGNAVKEFTAFVDGKLMKADEFGNIVVTGKIGSKVNVMFGSAYGYSYVAGDTTLTVTEEGKGFSFLVEKVAEESTPETPSVVGDDMIILTAEDENGNQVKDFRVFVDGELMTSDEFGNIIVVGKIGQKVKVMFNMAYGYSYVAGDTTLTITDGGKGMTFLVEKVKEESKSEESKEESKKDESKEEVKKEEAKKEEKKDEKGKLPETGESSTLMIVAGAIVALVAGAFLFIKNFKKEA